MNNPKLTNVLLIALVAINGLLLIGLTMSSTHHRHDFAMHNHFNGRHHNDFAFRYHHEGFFHAHHRGYYGNEHRNYNGYLTK